jgi:phosphohistidine phosphatase SixA
VHPSSESAPSGRVLAASELNTRDPEVIKRAYPHPKIDPAQELKGEALIRELRKGGFVLYMRHTQTGTVTPECTMSNLTTAGERDAAFIGNSIRSLRIPIDRVWSSPVCRVFDTAKLLGVASPAATNDLTNVAGSPAFDFDTARVARLVASPPSGSNTLLVGHLQRGKDESQSLYLDFGEIVAFRPDGKGGATPVARIRADDWANFKK